MSAKGKKIKYGNYLCKVGYLDIRQHVVLAKRKKNYKGEWESIPGSVEVFIYHAKHKMDGPFKSKDDAIKKAEEMLSEGLKYVKHKK